MMKDGFVSLAAATPRVKVADIEKNIAEIELLIREAYDKGCAAVCFPELSLTAATCGDLFRESVLLRAAENGLKKLMENTAELDILCAVGLPVALGSSVYSCAAVFHKGCLLGLPAKENIAPAAARIFSPAPEAAEISFCGQGTVIGKGLLFPCENVEGLCFGVELSEDLQSLTPPSAALSQSGATVILNPACACETVGKAEYTREIIKSWSARTVSAYVHASAGRGESTTDMVFSGHDIICENGGILSESELFTTGLTIAEADIEKLISERRRVSMKNSFDGIEIGFAYEDSTIKGFEPQKVFPRFPFIPEESELAARCELILKIQSEGLASRLSHIGGKTAVLGLSGGLDSTLALLVTVRAFDSLGLDRSGIHTISMPCFGTTGRTKSNAQRMAEEMGVGFREISIKDSVTQHFKDIGHDPENYDVTFENAQARERTQVLMDAANQCGGIVIGTGDLSELALGWATYNGDHMSMYAVNASIPKTLVRHLVKYEAERGGEALKAVLLDVLDTPVSPELLPPKEGEIAQKTEELVGPYELHDFFLFHVLRYGFSPKKIYNMACRSFEEEYAPQVIKAWLRIFYRRFFTQQFKRSCLPDGPKVGSVGVSPRGDLAMPSDASFALWLKEIDEI